MTHSMRDAEIKDFKAEKMYKAVLDRSFNVFNNTTNYQSKEVPSRQLHFRAQIPTQQSVMKDIFIRLPTRFRFYNASGRRISPYNVALADSGLDRIFKTVMMLINGRSYTIQPETVMFESTLYKPKTESSRDSGNYQPIAKLSRHNMNKCAEINYGFVERARDFRRNIGFEEDEKVDTRQEYYDYDVLIPLNIGLQSNFYRENLNCSDSLPFAYELELILHFNNEVSSADAEKHKPLGIEGQACWKNVLQIGNSLCELVVEDETPNDHHNDLHIGTNHYIELGGQVVTPDHADAANLHGSDGLADRAGVAGWQVIVIPVDDKDMGANAVFDVPNNNANTTALKSILVPTYALGNGLGAMGDRFSNHVGCPGVKPILYIENGTNDDFAALPAVNGFTKFEIEGVDRVGRHITVDRDVGMNVAGSNIYILNPIYVIDRGAGRNKADTTSWLPVDKIQLQAKDATDYRSRISSDLVLKSVGTHKSGTYTHVLMQFVNGWPNKAFLPTNVYQSPVVLNNHDLELRGALTIVNASKLARIYVRDDSSELVQNDRIRVHAQRDIKVPLAGGVTSDFKIDGIYRVNEYTTDNNYPYIEIDLDEHSDIPANFNFPADRSLHAGGGALLIQRVAPQIDENVCFIRGEFTENPTLITEVIVAEQLREAYRFQSNRIEPYQQQIQCKADYTFDMSRFNDIRLYEGFSYGILYCMLDEESRDVELFTSIGKNYLNIDLKRLQLNDEVCLVDAPQMFMYKQFKKLFPHANLSYNDWIDYKQCVVFNNETVASGFQPGDRKIGNLAIECQVKFSPLFERVVKNGHRFHNYLATTIEDGLIERESQETKLYLLGLKYKLALVLVYNDRYEVVDKSGQIMTKVVTRSFAEDGLKMKEPKSDVPSVGVKDMRSGGKITDFAY